MPVCHSSKAIEPTKHVTFQCSTESVADSFPLDAVNPRNSNSNLQREA